jgi:recombination protein RecR
MYNFPLSLRRLIRELSRLPSIGDRSATRLAYHLVYRDKDLARALSAALLAAADSVQFCSTCFALSESSICSICEDVTRDRTVLCVVEKPIDVLTIERGGEFRGLYHVLHGLWSPLRGRTPAELKIQELLARTVAEGSCVQEIIFATGATVEGDATALYVASELSTCAPQIKVTRIAQGIPKGGEVEYVDDITLARAFSGRAALS